MTGQVYTLAALAVTGPLSASIQTPIDGLSGIGAARLLAEMVGGTGGTSISALVQTSFDGGTIWLDVARFDWLTTASKKWCVIGGAAAKAIAAYAALNAEGVNDGLLGDRLRAVLTSVGTFTNTTLGLRVATW